MSTETIALRRSSQDIDMPCRVSFPQKTLRYSTHRLKRRTGIPYLLHDEPMARHGRNTQNA